MATTLSISFPEDAIPLYVAVAQLANETGKSIGDTVKTLIGEALAARTVQINNIKPGRQ